MQQNGCNEADIENSRSTLRNIKLQLLAQQRANSAKMKTANRPSSGPLMVKLSDVLKRYPQLFDRNKISAVERFISQVDILPSRYHDAEVVYLSKNSLTDLEGLKQFRRLRILSLSDNKLSHWGALDPLTHGQNLEAGRSSLSAQPALESLSLDGNPVAKHPNYRSNVIVLLPGLKSLDGQLISPEERAKAPRIVEQERSYFLVMLKNACSVHKMSRLYLQMQIHLELKQLMFSTKRHLLHVPFLQPDPAQPLRLVDMWDYEGSLNQQERYLIEGALRREVSRIHQNATKQNSDHKRASWDHAFSEAMLMQQRAVAQLIELLNHVRQLLIDDKHEKEASQSVFSAHAEEEQRQLYLQQDREQALQDLRDAFQQVRPGSKATSPHKKRQPDARSPKALSDQIKRTLYSVTKGSPQVAMTARKHGPRRSSSSSKLSLRNHGNKGPPSSSILDFIPAKNKTKASEMVDYTQVTPVVEDDGDSYPKMLMTGTEQLKGSRNRISHESHLGLKSQKLQNVSFDKRAQAGTPLKVQGHQDMHAKLPVSASSHSTVSVHPWSADHPHYEFSRVSRSQARHADNNVQPHMRQPQDSPTQSLHQRHELSGMLTHDSTHDSLGSFLRSTPQQPVVLSPSGTNFSTGVQQYNGHGRNSPAGAEAPPASGLLTEAALEELRRRTFQMHEELLSEGCRVQLPLQPKNQILSSSNSIYEMDSPVPQPRILHGSVTQLHGFNHEPNSACSFEAKEGSKGDSYFPHYHPDPQGSNQADAMYGQPTIPVSVIYNGHHPQSLHSAVLQPKHTINTAPVESAPGSRDDVYNDRAEAKVSSGWQQQQQELLQQDSRHSSFPGALRQQQEQQQQQEDSRHSSFPGALRQQQQQDSRHSSFPGALRQQVPPPTVAASQGPVPLQEDNVTVYMESVINPQLTSMLAQHDVAYERIERLTPTRSLMNMNGGETQDFTFQSPDNQRTGWRSSAPSPGVSSAVRPGSAPGAGTLRVAKRGVNQAGDHSLLSAPWSDLRQNRSAAAIGIDENRPHAQLSSHKDLPQGPEGQRQAIHRGVQYTPSRTGADPLPSVHRASTPGLPTSPTGQESFRHSPEAGPGPSLPSDLLSLKDLESQLMSLTLERAALEAALVGERGEVRLLQQELQVQLGEVERLQSEVESSRQLLEDTQLALQHEAEEVKEAEEQMNELKYLHAEEVKEAEEQMNELKQLHAEEAQRLRTEAEHQLSVKQLEVNGLLTRIQQLQKDGDVARICMDQQEAELRAEIDEFKKQIDASRVDAQLAAEIILQHQQHQTVLESTVQALEEQHRDFVYNLEIEERKMNQMDIIARQALLKRSFIRLCMAVGVSRWETKTTQASHFHYKSCLLKRAIKHWRMWLHKLQMAEVLRKRIMFACLRRYMQAWKIYHNQCCEKATRLAVAEVYSKRQLLFRALYCWQHWMSRIAEALGPVYMHEDVQLSSNAFATFLKKRAFHAWRTFSAMRAPRILAKIRAKRVHARKMKAKTWRGWKEAQCLIRQKQNLYSRYQYHRQAVMLRCAWAAWMRVMHRSRALQDCRSKSRQLRILETLLLWHHRARWQVMLRSRVSLLVAARNLSKLQCYWLAWGSGVERRRAKRREMTAAILHCQHRSLHTAFWAWLREAERAAQVQQQDRMEGAVRGAVKCILQWQVLSRALVRQQAGLDRAVRMYSHRVVTATQSKVFSAWTTLASVSRASRRSVAVSFCQSFLVIERMKLLSRAFHKWERACAVSLRTLAARLEGELHFEQRSVQAGKEQIHRASLEGARLIEQLDAATEKLAHVERSLGEEHDHVLRLLAQLEDASVKDKALSSDLESANHQISSLQKDLDILRGEVQSLTGELSRSCEEQSLLRAEIGGLHLEVAQNQGELKEAGLRMTQQAARSEATCLDLREVLSQAERALVTETGSSQRAQQRCLELELQMQQMKQSQDSKLTELRKELKFKDEQLTFIKAHHLAAAEKSAQQGCLPSHSKESEISVQPKLALQPCFGQPGGTQLPMQALISNSLLDPTITQRLALALNQEASLCSPKASKQESWQQTPNQLKPGGGSWEELISGDKASASDPRPMQTSKEHGLKNHTSPALGEGPTKSHLAKTKDSHLTCVSGADEKAGPSTYSSGNPKVDMLTQPGREKYRSMQIRDEGVADVAAHGSALSALLSSLSSRREMELHKDHKAKDAKDMDVSKAAVHSYDWKTVLGAATLSLVQQSQHK
ncbi:hypothetical protein CEUSTIGMA_g1625.t1 [Chlamydomonas eustigma]|uniref:U2A'/phosphoprotein 32 family A C-terminal domain-containing protein n=1 Tax=Chlamydomonas eustigma TaxID=1157962 RepID=A0A250WTU7_9CHLO|nr:hypothetical protein CEUSTIGMA_g1625.t1 [Chlamydomonas eustigma]|eukprot:GAX74176.1 hypothetical protein CEUSTIGMA_g1625.t1 [Chlamydomonas eustigma]